MDRNGCNDRLVSSWNLDLCRSNSYYDQTDAEYRPCLLSAHYSGSSGDHSQVVNSAGVMSIAYPGTGIPGPPHTLFYRRIYEATPSLPFHQQGSTYPIPTQALSCHYFSQVPATDKGYCAGGNQDTRAYPSSALAEQWDAREDQLLMYPPPEYIQPLCVAPSSPKNDVAVTSASPESPVLRGNYSSICDTVWSQDMGMYPANHAQWDAQALGPMLDTAGDEQPTSVSPSPIEDKAASIAFTVSTPKCRRPTHNTEKHCPICAAALGRFQDRKRHILSHLPHWLQCQAPGCSWRGDRWEHLRKHRLKAHLSSGQELDTRESIIYDPRPLIEGITDNITFENAKMAAISFVEKRAEELEKSELWGDLWGRKRTRSRRVYR